MVPSVLTLGLGHNDYGIITKCLLKEIIFYNCLSYYQTWRENSSNIGIPYRYSLFPGHGHTRHIGSVSVCFLHYSFFSPYYTQMLVKNYCVFPSYKQSVITCWILRVDRIRQKQLFFVLDIFANKTNLDNQNYSFIISSVMYHGRKRNKKNWP